MLQANSKILITSKQITNYIFLAIVYVCKVIS